MIRITLAVLLALLAAVPARADLVIKSVRAPHDVLFYDAGHELNDQAMRDRIAWLKKQLVAR